MPDSAHVMTFLGGLGSELAGAIKEKQDRERKQKEDQENFLDTQLLKSIQHPSTTVEDWNNVMENILQRRGKKAGVDVDQLRNVLGHIKQQVGTVTEQGPQASTPDLNQLSQETPEQLQQVTRPRTVMVQRPKTMGDLEAEQLFKKAKATSEGSEPSKLAIEKQKALTKATFEETRQQHRLELQDSRHADNLDTIQARNDIKGMTAYNERLKLNQLKVARGEMTQDQAELEASNYARSLSDTALQSKAAGVELTKARIDKARKDIENIDADNKRADAQLGIAQKKLADQLQRTTIMDDRLKLSGLQAELGTLRTKRVEATAAQRQAMAIVSNPMLFDQQKKEEANWEWNRREQEVKDIDRRIAEINGALPSGKAATATTTGGGTAPAPKALAKTDAKLKAYADKYFGGDVERARAYAAAHP